MDYWLHHGDVVWYLPPMPPLVMDPYFSRSFLSMAVRIQFLDPTALLYRYFTVYRKPPPYLHTIHSIMPTFRLQIGKPWIRISAIPIMARSDLIVFWASLPCVKGQALYLWRRFGCRSPCSSPGLCSSVCCCKIFPILHRAVWPVQVYNRLFKLARAQLRSKLNQ